MAENSGWGSDVEVGYDSDIETEYATDTEINLDSVPNSQSGGGSNASNSETDFPTVENFGSPTGSLAPMAQYRQQSTEVEDDDADEHHPEEENPANFFEISDKKAVTVAPRFGYSGEAYYLNFKNQDKMTNAQSVIETAFKETFRKAFQDSSDKDMVGVALQHPSLDHEILIKFCYKKDCCVKNVLDVVEKVQQSKKELNFDEQMEVKVTKIEMPKGKGYKKMNAGKFEEWFKQHSNGHGGAIFQIKNQDHTCCARAIVVARAQLEKEWDSTVKWESIRKGDANRYTSQRDMAYDLIQRAGLCGFQQPCGIPELAKFQNIIGNYGFQLKVFSRDYFNAIIFEGSPAAHVLYLYHHDNHYDVLKTPRILTGTNHWCDVCNRGYERVEKHKCKAVCPCCKTNKGWCMFEKWICCRDCNRNFVSQKCFNNHKMVESGSEQENKQPMEDSQPCENSRKRKAGKAGESEPSKKKAKKAVKKSMCKLLKRCKMCNRTVRAAELAPVKHHCGQRYCNICKKWDNESDHQCYIQPIKEKQDKENLDLLPEEREEDPDCMDALIREHEEADGVTNVERDQHFSKYSFGKDKGPMKFIFFDFECIQENIIGSNKWGPIYLHEPNFCVARKACELCKDYWLEKCGSCNNNSCEKCAASKPDCTICKEHRKIFMGDDCKEQFCDWLFSEAHENFTVIAHNSKGYDSHFLIQYLGTKHILPKIIPRGLSILSIEACKIKIIDSMSFLPMGLSALPRAFSETELKKGYFPFLFCKRENFNYTGPWPEAHFYDPTHMTAAKREDFFKWYKQQQGKIFNFKKELLEYCESDVDILLKCCLKFRELFRAETGVDPFEVSITIASACNYVFRKNFLKEKSIGVVPYGGYRRREKQSATALKWLKWLSHQNNIQIQHARNNGEKKVDPYKTDGFDGEKCYEFYGCVWHGCPKCIKKRNRKVPGSALTMDEMYQRTFDRANYIKSQGYQLVEIWECEFNTQLKNDEQMMTFVNSLEIREPLDPRKAFFGGRTNATKLFHKCGPNEYISYVDVCSLYPWVCKYGIYPRGHPTIITENFATISKDYQPYFGLISCKVLPPRRLLHPVLPNRSHDKKLMFSLCRTCQKMQNKERCQHSDEERSFTGVWVSSELDKALELGYKVLETYEVWHYEQFEKYDGEDEDTGLFTKYINCFLKLKAQASGWPGWVKTVEDKEKFVVDFERKERIQLDLSKIEKNSGLRSIAKLMLNSFWGKFGQRSNMNKTEFVQNPADFLNLIWDEENILSSVRKISETTMAVSYHKEDEFVDILPNTNIVIAAFTTAQARLKLYSYIEQLQERVLYFDTDSVIYLTRPGDSYQPSTGSYLGDMTDELEEYGPGSIITEFASGGPKNYGFRIKTPEGKLITKCKVKGFGLNYITAAHVNFQRLKKQVRDFVKENHIDKVAVVQPQIRRMKNHNIVTVMTKKEHKVVYNKRVVCHDFTSLPYGY